MLAATFEGGKNNNKIAKTISLLIYKKSSEFEASCLTPVEAVDTNGTQHEVRSFLNVFIVWVFPGGKAIKLQLSTSKLSNSYLFQVHHLQKSVLAGTCEIKRRIDARTNTEEGDLVRLSAATLTFSIFSRICGY